MGSLYKAAVLVGCVLEKYEAVAKRQQMAGLFVLLSNLPGEDRCGYSAEQILRTYKDQRAIQRESVPIG